MSVLQKKITLNCAPVVAFDVFTRQMPKWWPVDSHSVSAGSGDVPASLIVERKRDGQIVEIDKQGNSHLWGNFQAYEAPYRVNIAWHVDEPASRATYIEVVFGMETNGDTVVVLSHGGWSALGDDAEATRLAYDTGWDYVFGECYKNACVEAAKNVVPIREPQEKRPQLRKKPRRAVLSSLSQALHIAQ